MLKTIEIDLVYQPTIDGPPQAQEQIYSQACSGDEVTVNTWREIWIRNYRAAKERFGSFQDKSIGQLHNVNHQKPAIVIGSGPSLKENLEALKDNAAMKNPVMTISCLHNFGYFEDEGFHADYYLSLDSGPIVVSDVSEGRKESPEYYWEKTKDKVLLAYVASDPKLFELWQGKIYLFNCLIPDLPIRAEFDKIERFAHYVSCGGNALGGCMYIAKAIMGSDAILYVGVDACFDYNNTFHSYKTHYDNPGNFVVWPSVYGIMRKTWPSYLNFKFWFDHVACTVPGRWVNCSSGLLGAYREGNIKQYVYQPLKEALIPYQLSQRVYLESRGADQALIQKEEIHLNELFSNTSYEKDIVLF